MRNLVAASPEAWPYEDDPVTAVFGSVCAYLGERWHAISPPLRAAFSATPLLPCGACFVKPRRAFHKVAAACAPLLQPVTAISCAPAPAAELLAALGVAEEPSLQDYLDLLRELPAECSRGGARLTPSERGALLAVLRLATSSPAFRPDPSLAVATEDGAVATVGTAVINDAPWLLRRLRADEWCLASAALEAPLRARLQLRALSAHVREVLVRQERCKPKAFRCGNSFEEVLPTAAPDLVSEGWALESLWRQAPGHEPTIETTTDDARAMELTQRIHSMDFAAAAAALLGADAGQRDPTLSGEA